MKTKIGLIAGKIWETLQANGEMTLAQLSKVLDEKSTDVYQELRWLAGEDKSKYRAYKGKHIFH